jgi:SagB-type dehydrogenase family enzyme
MARYGQRGLRFALLEAGHLAQNLVLVATALGWSSITLGGFYDDELAIAAGLDGVSQLPVYLLPMGVGLTKQSLDD